MSASPPIPSSPSNATPSRSGLMSPADKTKVDGVAAGATATPLSSATPQAVGTAGAGVSGNASRADHAHDLPAVGPGAGAIGTAGITSITLDAKGRVTTATPLALVPQSRTLTAGAGLTGTGDLSNDRTLAVGANGDGSIVVNADDVQVGVLATDAQHGARGGGTQHAAAIASGAAGFLSGADKAKLDGLPASAVPTSRTLTAGAGLTGTGDLSADRTFAVGANADGSITVNADDVQVGILATDAQHGARGGGTQHAAATTTAAGFMSAVDKTKTDAQGSRLVRVGWAWIKGSDGTKLAGSSNVTTGRTSTGVYTATLTGGATYTVAQPSYLTSTVSIPYYVQAIATSSTVATVETISRTGAATDQDVLVFLLADTGAPSALSEIGWVWVKGADGTKLAGSPNILPARSSTGTYTATLVGGATYSVAVTTLIRSGTGTVGRLLSANTTSSTALALFTNDTGGTLIDTDFLVRFYV